MLSGFWSMLSTAMQKYVEFAAAPKAISECFSKTIDCHEFNIEVLLQKICSFLFCIVSRLSTKL